MGKLKILASGDSPQAKAQARGKLFENLMAEVLRHLGYKIDRTHNTNYAGMEIDIEGESTVMQVPFYAECKYYETNIDAPKLQAFYGKYMTRWRKNNKSQGLFIAIPGFNPHAKGFYKDNIENDSEITFRILEEDDVLKELFKSTNIAQPETIAKNIPTNIGSVGDWLLIYTDKGMFWIQYIISIGQGIPNKIAVFDAKGNPISDKSIVEYLIHLYPEMNNFGIITIGNASIMQTSGVQKETEQIVEVKGSSACFEYQFPASPNFFVGRQEILSKVDAYVKAVIGKKTSSRGLLFEANSGWGKSSVVLACVSRLIQNGHFAIAIDCRSASSSQFILHVVNYALSKFRDFDGFLSERQISTTITGFEGAVETLANIGRILEQNGKVMFIFLDQFENLFFQQESLARIRDLFLKIQDAQTNVVLGFSWKTDLVGITSEFPYRMRDDIRDSSKQIELGTFSNIETDALLNKLKEELRVPKLRKDLRFFLSEFSQGYPWLLKKLCAHVKTQIENGTPQTEIAYSLLNIEELFREDLKGLSAKEEEALRRIAKSAPISIQELGEEFEHDVIQSLVDRRLLVRIGSKYDVYWDIFRDYLNTNRVPVQENYILHTQISSVLRAVNLLVKKGGSLSRTEFRARRNLSKNSLYNVLRDMRLLNIIQVDGDNIKLSIELQTETGSFEGPLIGYLRERLKRNRLIWKILRELEAKGRLTVNEISDLLKNSCPYISATEKTWQTYARIFTKWITLTGLAISNNREGALNYYSRGEREIPDLRPFLAGRRGGIIVPPIQYGPIEEIAIRLVDALEQESGVDWHGLKRSTIAKSLGALEELDFIRRTSTSITLLPVIEDFVKQPQKRTEIFAEAALKIDSFAIFVDTLREYENKRLSLSELGMKLKEKLGTDWKEGTAKTNAKIMLNWARHTNLAPGVWSHKYKRKAGQPTLFSHFENER